METLHKYISEGLFSNDEIGDQVDKEFEKSIINKFKEKFKENNKGNADYLLKNMRFKYDKNINSLIINIINCQEDIIKYNSKIYKNLNINIRFSGDIYKLIIQVFSDTPFDTDIFKDLNYNKLDLINLYSSKLKSIKEFNFNLLNGYDEINTFNYIFDEQTKININLKERCPGVTLKYVNNIKNIYFNPRSVKNNGELILEVVDKNYSDEKYTALEEKMKYFCNFFKSIVIYIADNELIHNNQANGVIHEIKYNKNEFNIKTIIQSEI